METCTDPASPFSNHQLCSFQDLPWIWTPVCQCFSSLPAVKMRMMVIPAIKQLIPYILCRSFQCMQACSSLCTAFFDACPSADPILPPAPADNVDFAYLLSNMRGLQPQQQ